MKLINATERKPKHYTIVLVVDNGMYHIAHRVVNPEGWQAIETGIRLRDVSHWGHLPKVLDT
jgi:adenylyl- and sulfurtransferase ThiI